MTQSIGGIISKIAQFLGLVKVLENRLAGIEERVADLEGYHLELDPDPDPLPDPEPIPEPSGIVVSPGDSIQEAIRDANHGDNINLRRGTYTQQIFFDATRNGLTLRAYPGDEGLVRIDGRVPLDLQWEFKDGVYSAPYSGYPSLWTRVDKAATAPRNKVCRPELVTHGNDPLVQVNSVAELYEGTFFIAGEPASATRIFVRLDVDQNIENLQISRFPWLIDGAVADVAGNGGAPDIGFENLIVAGCSNTTKIGMFNVAGPAWRLRRISVELANTINIKLGSRVGSVLKTTGQRLDLSEIKSYRPGQMHYWGSFSDSKLENFKNYNANWGGFEPGWEAVFKIETSTNSVVRNGECYDDNGMSIWADIQNRNIVFEDIRIENAMRQGLLIEHYADAIQVRNVVVDGVRKYRGFADGFGIQSNVRNCLFENLTARNVENALRYKKLEGNERDKGSGNNTIRNLVAENITGRHIYFEGSNSMPDVIE